MNAESVRRFAAIWSALEAALDWERLGVLHCHEGGEGFFGEEARQALLEAGLLFADDLGRLLRPGGASLYVGASAAELVPMIVETQVLERRVQWVELPGETMELLVRGLERAECDVGCNLPRPIVEGWEAVPALEVDHLWMVSVLNDPEVFPALHDELYQRTGELATGRGDLALERERALELAQRALARLAPPGWLSTTDEELSLLGPRARDLGLVLEVPETARLSAVVGDPVRHCAVRTPASRS